MSAPERRRFMRLIIVLAIGAPLGVMLLDARLGAFLLLVGLFVAAAASRALANASVRSLMDDPLFDREQLARGERGQTVYVRLTDDAGRALAPEAAQQKLDDARRLAGPRDVIVPLRATSQTKPED